MKQSGKNDSTIKRITKRESVVFVDSNLYNHSFSDFEMKKKWTLEKDRKEAEHRESLSNILK